MWTSFYFLISLISVAAHAGSDSRLIYESAAGIDWVINDKAHPGEVLIKEHGGELVQVRLPEGLKSAKVIARYEDRCGLTDSYWSELEWASPALVTVKKSCVLKAGALIAAGEHPKLQNAFAMSFLSRGEGRSHFLVNSRPWKTAGLIHLKTVHDDGRVEIRELVNEIPGFSGPMAVDPSGRSLVYTEATGESFNRVYQIATERLRALVQSGGPVTFSELAQAGGGFPGMSLWISSGSKGDLYGDEKGAFLFQKSGVRALKPVENCKAVGLAEISGESQVVLHCSENSVRLQPLAILLSPAVTD